MLSQNALFKQKIPEDKQLESTESKKDLSSAKATIDLFKAAKNRLELNIFQVHQEILELAELADEGKKIVTVVKTAKRKKYAYREGGEEVCTYEVPEWQFDPEIMRQLDMKKTFVQAQEAELKNLNVKIADLEKAITSPPDGEQRQQAARHRSNS